MRTTSDRVRERFQLARVARLATASADGVPHLVPITFAVSGDVLYFAIDAKPKSTRHLRRLANIAANPAVSVLVDHYDEDWTQLWWARADGAARIVDVGDDPAGAALLADRYPVYRDRPADGPLVVVDVTHWSGWQAAGADAGGGQAQWSG